MTTRTRLIEWTTWATVDGERQDVTAAASVTGRYERAVLYGDNACPEAFPEVELDCVTGDSGEDVLDTLSRADLHRLEEEAEAEVTAQAVEYEMERQEALAEDRHDAEREDRAHHSEDR
jgi:hypothetical protein